MTTLPKPKKRRWFTRWWFWLIVVIIVITVISGVSGAASYQKFQTARYGYLTETVSVQKRILNKTISTNGQVAPDNSTQLFPSRPGRVEKVNAQVGDEVNKNDVLIKLNTGEEIKAPFDGKILDVATFVDDLVTGGAPLMQIGFRSNHIEFIASEAEVLDVRTGQPVTITIPAVDAREKYNGTVEFVDVKKQTVQQGVSAAGGAVSESGYLVKVSADDLPDYARDVIGLSVDLVVDVYQTESVLSLEPSAIQYTEDDQPFVYLPPVIDEQFIAQAQATEDITDLLETKTILTGFSGDEYVEITDGLNEGDRVLLFIPDGEAEQFSLF